MYEIMTDTIECHIYKTKKKAELYLYLAEEDNFDVVPKDILGYFGTPEKAMVIELSPERKLARVDVNEVLKSLKTNQFFIQMPPLETEKIAVFNQEK